MFNLIKEIVSLFFSILGFIGILLLFYILIFGSNSVDGQEVPIFEIPVQIDPGSERVIFIPSYNFDTFDLNSYIDRSNETGLYPNWGWAGEYYVTGVTHGSVHDEYSIDFSGSSINNINNEVKNIPVVPEPSSIYAGILFLALLILRNRLCHEDMKMN